MTSSNGNIFRVTGHLCGNSPVPGEFIAQRPVTRSFDVSLICAWIHGWVNNREAGDLWRHRAHYDVILTHWGRVTHICVSKLITIGSDNGLSPGRRQAIIWTNAGILLIGTLGTNFSEILSEIHTFSFKKMHLKMASILSRPQWVNNRVQIWACRLFDAVPSNYYNQCSLIVNRTVIPAL